MQQIACSRGLSSLPHCAVVVRSAFSETRTCNVLTDLCGVVSVVAPDHVDRVVADTDLVACTRTSARREIALRFDETSQTDTATAAVARRYSNIVDVVRRLTGRPAAATPPRHDRPNVDGMCAPFTDRKQSTSPRRYRGAAMCWTGCTVNTCKWWWARAALAYNCTARYSAAST